MSLPIIPAVTTTAVDTATADTCQLRLEAGPATAGAKAPTRKRNVVNISKCKNHASGSLKMCGFLK